jgi:hypothetical protein
MVTKSNNGTYQDAEGDLPILDLLEQPALPWEQREGEGFKAFEAFVCYRDLGAERSVLRVAAELAKSRQLVDRWRQQHNWQGRVHAWDRAKDAAWQRAQNKAMLDMAERHAGIASIAVHKAFDKLQSLNVDNLGVANAIRLLEVGAMLERLSRGAATANVSAEVYGRGAGGSIQIRTYDAYADAALSAITQAADGDGYGDEEASDDDSETVFLVLDDGDDNEAFSN